MRHATATANIGLALIPIATIPIYDFLAVRCANAYIFGSVSRASTRVNWLSLPQSLTFAILPLILVFSLQYALWRATARNAFGFTLIAVLSFIPGFMNALIMACLGQTCV